MNKLGLKGCKWSSLNAPGTHTPLSHSVLELHFSLFSLLALWGNKNWPPSIKVQEMENSMNKLGLKCCKVSSLNAPGNDNPLSYPYLELVHENERNGTKTKGEIQISRVMLTLPSAKNGKRGRTGRSVLPTPTYYT